MPRVGLWSRLEDGWFHEQGHPPAGIGDSQSAQCGLVGRMSSRGVFGSCAWPIGERQCNLANVSFESRLFVFCGVCTSHT
jgi:hypothetical protein